MNTGLTAGREFAVTLKVTVTVWSGAIVGITTGSAPPYAAPSTVTEPATNDVSGGSMSVTVVSSAFTVPTFFIARVYVICSPISAKVLSADLVTVRFAPLLSISSASALGTYKSPSLVKRITAPVWFAASLSETSTAVMSQP